MKSIGLHFVKWLAITLTVILVLLACLLSFIRIHAGDNEYLKTIVEVQLEKTLQQEVYIDLLRIDSTHLLPRIYLRDIQFGSARAAESVLQVDEALIDLNWLRSVRKRRISLDKIRLQGIDVELQRDQQGNIRINQGLLLPLLAVQAPADTAAFRLALEVSNLSIRWKDDRLKIDYLFPSVDLSLQPGRKSSELYAAGQLPTQLGRQVIIAAQLDGGLDQWLNSEIRFYLKGSELHLHEIASHFRYASVPIPADLSIETWGIVQQGAVTQLLGNLSFTGLDELSADQLEAACNSEDYIRSVTTRFKWSDMAGGWKLQLQDLDVNSSLTDWPNTALSVIRKSEYGVVRTLAHTNYLESGAVCNTISRFPGGRQILSGLLGELSARIELWDATMFLDQSIGEIVHFGVDVGDFRLDAHRQSNGEFIRGLGGHLLWGDEGGRFRPGMNTIALRQPKWFPEFPLTMQLSGLLEWTNHDGDVHIWSDQFRVSNDDIELLQRFSIRDPLQAPYVDMQMVLARGTLPAIAKYFPAHPRVSKTRNWLQQALQDGSIESASALLRGKLDQFPFAESGGVFRVSGQVTAGRLNYRPDWPQLQQIDASVEIEDDRIVVASDQARVLNSGIPTAHVEITSFLKPVARIRGAAVGEGTDLLEFLRQAGMVHPDKSLFGELAVSGKTRLELEIDKSLSPEVSLPLRVAGSLEFVDAAIGIAPLGLDFSAVNGVAQFDHTGIRADGIHASLLGQEINISALPSPDGHSMLTISGPLDVGQYVANRFALLEDVVSGTAELQASIKVPSIFHLGGAEKVSYEVSSGLQGVTIDLPEPFAKQADERLPFHLGYSSGEGALRISLQKLLALSLTELADGSFELGHIHLGEPQQDTLTGRVALVSGALDTLDLKSWWAYWSSRQQKQTTVHAQQWPSIHLEVKRLRWGDFTADGIKLIGLQERDYYKLGVDSAAALGRIRIPTSAGISEQAIELDFDHLQLPSAGDSKKESELPSPVDFPLFEFDAQRLQVGSYKFNNASIRTQRLPQGIGFKEIKLHAQDLTVTAHGSWRKLGDGLSSTEFVIDLNSIDVEDSLEALGFTSAIGKGDAKIRADVRWRGSPLDFRIGSAWADVDLNIWDGVVKEVDPGAGRFVALFNLGAIGRRLALDFKDVTDAGFTFDSIIGQLSLRDGNLFLHDVTLLSSTADIVMNGQTSLIEKTYDQQLSVTPKLTGGLPVAGALLGGPVVGAAIILAEQLSKSVGTDINKVGTTQYTLTGTWQDPQFDRIAGQGSATGGSSRPVQSLPP